MQNAQSEILARLLAFRLQKAMQSSNDLYLVPEVRFMVRLENRVPAKRATAGANRKMTN
jgi:hypothetical protein